MMPRTENEKAIFRGWLLSKSSEEIHRVTGIDTLEIDRTIASLKEEIRGRNSIEKDLSFLVEMGIIENPVALVLTEEGKKEFGLKTGEFRDNIRR